MLRLVNQFAWKKQFHSLWSLSKRAQTQISHEILRKYKPKISIAFYLIAVLIYSIFWGCHCIEPRHILCKFFSFPHKQSIIVFTNVIEIFTRKFVTWRWRKCDKHELIDTDVHFCLVSKTLRNWKSAFGVPHRHSQWLCGLRFHVIQQHSVLFDNFSSSFSLSGEKSCAMIFFFIFVIVRFVVA